MSETIKRPGNEADLQVDRCCVCGVEYAIPKIILEDRHRNGGSWFCPNGHSLTFTESEADKMRKERDRYKQQLAQKDDEINDWKRRANESQRSAAAYKGEATKVRNRAKHGVCPCCNRSFQNLRRHMATQHPEFDPGDLPALLPAPNGKG